ncbi:hypothetical protein [Bacillus weihaiensis]|uniref:hypothetical protein n=1 Tax=Bacillus weihaiensis TaxID=1547283 RepID=UPI00235560E3|nr:hypothetical protein [Bacillus weihaiensis]
MDEKDLIRCFSDFELQVMVERVRYYAAKEHSHKLMTLLYLLVEEVDRRTFN